MIAQDSPPPLPSPSSWFRDFGKRCFAFWYGEAPPQTLGVFRILLGLYLLIGWGSVAPRVALYYSSEGMAFPILDPPAGPASNLRDLLAILIQPPEPEVAYLLYAIVLGLAVLILVGWWTRPALIMFATLYCYYWLLQLHSLQSSFDRLVLVITILLACGECDAVFSLRARWRRRRGMDPVRLVPIWPARLIAAQIAFMYFGTGVFKILAPGWTGGEMLYYSLQGDWASPLAFWLVQWDLPMSFYHVMVLATIVIEVWAPWMLFHPVWQKPFFILGFCFHFSISVLLNIWPFMIMPAAYVLFIDPATFRDWSEAIGARWPFRSRVLKE
jgi:hypothetical protein